MTSDQRLLSERTFRPGRLPENVGAVGAPYTPAEVGIKKEQEGWSIYTYVATVGLISKKGRNHKTFLRERQLPPERGSVRVEGVARNVGPIVTPYIQIRMPKASNKSQ